MSFRKYNEGGQGDGSSRPPFIDPTSPDPVEMVRQYEEDENLANILQAEFDREILIPPRFIGSPTPNDTSEIGTSEDDIDDVEPSDESVLDLELRDEADQELESIDVEIEDALDDTEDEEDIGDEEEDEESLDDIEDEESLEDIENDEDIDDEEDEESGDEDEDGELDEEEEEEEEDRGRLFPDEIDRLPTHVSATPRSSRVETRMCQICMESYEKGDELRMLPCFHEFHTRCIDPWLLKSTTCPVCRIKVDLTGES